jgi:hypothetical protein
MPADRFPIGAGHKIMYARACPVHEGDVLSVTERAGRTWRKTGRRGGELAFAEKITEYRNQHGDLAVVATTVAVHTENVIGSDR